MSKTELIIGQRRKCKEGDVICQIVKVESEIAWYTIDAFRFACPIQISVLLGSTEPIEK